MSLAETKYFLKLVLTEYSYLFMTQLNIMKTAICTQYSPYIQYLHIISDLIQ